MAKMDEAKKKSVIEAMWKAIAAATASAALSKAYFRALVTGEEPDAGVIAGITSDGAVVPGTSGAAAVAAVAAVAGKTAPVAAPVDPKKIALVEAAKKKKAAEEAAAKKKAEDEAKAAADAASTDDSGLGLEDAGGGEATEPTVTMEDIMKEATTYFKKHGKEAFRAHLDTFTKGKVQEIPKERWDEFYMSLSA